jgi:predicted transcriptional regulator
MSAQAGRVIEFPHSKRAPEAQPVAKLEVFEHVRSLIRDGELKHIDMNVVQYLAEITDKETGTALVEVARIAERVSRSRPTAVRSLRRLIDAGVIEREARRRGKRCFASIYRLADPSGLKGFNNDTPRLTDEPSPVHGCTTLHAFDKNPSPNCNAPYRGRIAEISLWTAREWDDCAEWLAKEGKLARWGPRPGEAWLLATKYLDRWRDQSGDSRVVAAIERAKMGNGGSGWFGNFLIEKLEKMLGDCCQRPS